MIPRPDPNFIHRAAQRRRAEREPREVGEFAVGSAVIEIPTELSGRVGETAGYEGDMLAAPFLKFRETPSPSDPLDFAPIVSYSSDYALSSEDAAGLVVMAKNYVDSEGQTVWYFVYKRGLPAGGLDGMVLHVYDDGGLAWDYPHILRPF